MTKKKEPTKYYWLHLYDSTFRDPRMKKIRRMPNGPLNIVIYLKMQLLSLKERGRVFFEGIEDTLEDEIALAIDEETEDVSNALTVLKQIKLVAECDEGLLFYGVPENIGCETEWAIQKRDQRARHKCVDGQCPDNVQQMSGHCPPEREEKKEVATESNSLKGEISPALSGNFDMYGRFKNVRLRKADHEAFVSEYPEIWQSEIETLSEYKKSTGKTYKDDYAVLCRFARQDSAKYKSSGNHTSHQKYSPDFHWDGEREYSKEEYAEIERAMRERH